MTLDDKKKSNDFYGDQERVPTPDEIWKILKRVAQHQEDMAKRQIKYEQEARKRQKKYEQEARKRQEKYEQETRKRQEKYEQEAKKRQEEADQRQEKYEQEAKKRQEEARKRQEEADQRQEKYEQEARKRREENEKQINKMRGIWSNAWGDFVESLVSGCLVEMIREWIPSINQIMKNIECERNGRHCEIDIIAVNNDSLVATEVKSTLSVIDVKDFLEKLKSFTMFFPQFKGYKIYGAVAYLKTNQNAEKFAMRRGLFVIKATGDHGEILNKKGVFKPEVIKQIYDNNC